MIQCYDPDMKKLALLAVVAVVAVAGYRVEKHHTSQAHLVRDRVWLDHMPRNDRDTVNVFAVLSRQPVGVFQATSGWKGNFEAFRYEQNGDEIRIVYPQTGDKEKLVVRARECNEKGMDYCLDIEGGSRGVKRYYSREEWVIENTGDIQTLLEH